MQRTCLACGTVFKAGHPRAQFCSSTCRSRSRRAKLELSESEELYAEAPLEEGMLLAERIHRRLPPRQEYVEHEVEITRRQMELGWIRTNPIVHGRDRLDRSRAYANWRYDRVAAGEVYSL